ncbi:MAG TPA: 3-oxoacyl-ACP reductase FabG [Chloroflexota bacterium]|nr:3-oxoacyl-ACP reductase FabG [Chloroflexota bacterium]
MLLQNDVAMITGAGNGIGRATAVRLAKEGARVVIADLDEVGLAETQQQVEAAGGQATIVVGSVAARDDVQTMVDTAVATYGKLTVLINNAGITRDGLTTRIKEGQAYYLSDDKWDAVLEVNLKGTWLCCQLAAVPMMAAGYGRIVNTASIAALGNIGQANYAASKAGVMGLTKTLALEWARYGIAVNCVAPGGVNTNMTKTIPEKIIENLLKGIPFGRFAEPEEIAAVHAFLASREASYITGQTLFVDGGVSVGA